ncbi:probable RNA methyltransferase At5g51130 [Impatiens glandulifera]|uniref:probable RNA methyltransferase At5g51130 n=1 Tax=Impatiens glandulifera TaxID=253017 RepID=UPI001FB0EAE7|nr:probable RNA methyltransferase At5g51130 [Impatiens glandulifera]
MGIDKKRKKITQELETQEPITSDPAENIATNENLKNGNEGPDTLHPNKKKKGKVKGKEKEIAIYGNYRHYYGYRIGQGLDEDPRIKVMKKEWFEGKDCLDIGCNAGSITISIARKFDCRSILGIDIDDALVKDAFWNLRRIVNMIKQKNAATTTTKDLFDIVSFQKENFVQSAKSHENKSYHTILCLSVAKWIHLNWGDEGLITLFTKVWNLLEPGGIFILEPQPWLSYYKNRLVSKTTQSNYHGIKICPEQFQEILLDKIGFRTVENISADLPSSKSGFNRPILAFTK